MMKLRLLILVQSLFIIHGALAAQQFECQDACKVVQDDVGCDIVRLDIADSGKAHVTWVNASNHSVVETGSLSVSGVSKKHPGYTVFSGEASDGSGRVLFALPTERVGSAEVTNFTGYFYDLENDGGPDVPLGFTMDCWLK